MRSTCCSPAGDAARPSRRRVVRALLAGSVLALTAPLAACVNQPAAAGKGAAPAASASAATGGAVVEMTDQNRFVPAALTVTKGTTVTWKNTGRIMPHNVVTDPKLAADASHAKVPAGAEVFASPMLTRGQTWQYTFTVAGDYTYFCQPHEGAGMVGTITVTE